MIVINQNYYQPMREARIEQGLTQRELGRRSGIPYQTIKGYEQGRNNPTAGRLRSLAEVLGLDVEDYPLPPKRTPVDERNELLKKYMDLPGYIIWRLKMLSRNCCSGDCRRLRPTIPRLAPA